jgi:hypothetical protein
MLRTCLTFLGKRNIALALSPNVAARSFTESLEDKKCVPCEKGGDPLPVPTCEAFHKQLKPEWTLDSNKKITLNKNLGTFVKALAWINKVGDIAEKVNLHAPLMIR